MGIASSANSARAREQRLAAVIFLRYSALVEVALLVFPRLLHGEPKQKP